MITGLRSGLSGAQLARTIKTGKPPSNPGMQRTRYARR